MVLIMTEETVQVKLRDKCRFGLFLNAGATTAPDVDSAFALLLDQAELAEDLDFDELWVSEHHFIRYGLNPSSLTLAAFLLGRTRHIRVGTAVVLSPLAHPVEIAERAALLDRLSGGRFELGLGRGGYRLDYEVLRIDVNRWHDEPVTTAQVVLDAWAGGLVALDHQRVGFGQIPIEPPPLTSRAPILIASGTDETIAFAARQGLPLQHYFAATVARRLAAEERYRHAIGDADRADPAKASQANEGVAHLHTIPAVIDDDEPAARARLAAALANSFRDGDQPGLDAGRQRDRGAMDDMIRTVTAEALVGSPTAVREQLERFIGRTGARRIAIFPEAIGEPAATLRTIELFMTEVLG